MEPGPHHDRLDLRVPVRPDIVNISLAKWSRFVLAYAPTSARDLCPSGSRASPPRRRSVPVSIRVSTQPSEAKMIVTEIHRRGLEEAAAPGDCRPGAARCARRVEHLALLPDDHPETVRWCSAVSNAIRLVEDFANGVPCSSSESVVREVEASGLSLSTISCAIVRWAPSSWRRGGERS